MKRILVLRLSAMGDVALTVPVLRSFLSQNKDHEIVLLTRKFFAPFFYGIERLILVHPDLDGKHSNLKGLIALSKEIQKTYKIGYTIDLHDVLRTKVIRNALRVMYGINFEKIDKGRKEKKDFIQRKTKNELKHSTERYRDVFLNAGFEINNVSLGIRFSDENIKTAKDYLQSVVSNKENNLIGIAPFAKHRSKQWGISKIQDLVQKLSVTNTIFLFGGGKQETEILENIAKENKNVFSAAGKFNLGEELALISLMDKMLSMDSSNMHMSSLVGTKTYSIWGATHPFVGFKALGQSEETFIQINRNELECRPCSVFGNKECARTDLPYKCMEDISVDTVFEKLNSDN